MTPTPRTGDWIEVRGLPGHPTRRGKVLEILGEGPHVHFLVRWDEEHESLLFPAGGAVRIVRPDGPES